MLREQDGQSGGQAEGLGGPGDRDNRKEEATRGRVLHKQRHGS